MLRATAITKTDIRGSTVQVRMLSEVDLEADGLAPHVSPGPQAKRKSAVRS